MVTLLPKDVVGLQECWGMGPKKTSAYGADLLAALEPWRAQLETCQANSATVKGPAQTSATASGEKEVVRRELHLYDSFEGLPPATAGRDPRGYSGGGAMKCGPEDVIANFQALGLQPPTMIHKGWFADTW